MKFISTRVVDQIQTIAIVYGKIAFTDIRDIFFLTLESPIRMLLS